MSNHPGRPETGRGAGTVKATKIQLAHPKILDSSPVVNPACWASGSGGQPALVISASVGQSLRREEPPRTSSPEELHRLVSGAFVTLPYLDCGDILG